MIHCNIHAHTRETNFGKDSRGFLTLDVKEIRAPVKKVSPPTLRPRRRKFLIGLCRVPHGKELPALLARTSLISQWGWVGHHPEHVPCTG
jgi:hypothetical protein